MPSSSKGRLVAQSELVKHRTGWNMGTMKQRQLIAGISAIFTLALVYDPTMNYVL